MAFRPADVIGLIWHHPIVSAVVLLLFTPPLFPIMVYFSPLLISTALAVLAMISMGSDHEDSTNSYNDDIPFKKVWIEEVDVDGPSLDGERVPKRLKALSKDETWFDKVKNWEGTGRAWVESVLSQEARKSVSSNDSVSSRDESMPLLDKAREFFLEDIRKRSPEPEYVPKTSSRPIEGQEISVVAKDSSPKVPTVKSGTVHHPARVVPVDTSKSTSEITPELESEDELIEIAPANRPPSPLFRSKSLPRANAAASVPVEVSKADDASTGVKPEAVESVRSVPGTESEDGNGKKTASRSISSDENCSIPLVVERILIERAPVDVENSDTSADVPSPSDVSVANGGYASSQVTDPSAAGETKPGIKPASLGVSSIEGTDRNPADKSQADSNSGKSVMTEAKSATELLSSPRQDQASSYGLATPSAAVALSEKLKVPLADIMSLLAGEDKPNASSEGPSGVKVSSPSETTTTSSQEEDWSNSDVDSPAPPPLEPLPGLASAEKDT